VPLEDFIELCTCGLPNPTPIQPPPSQAQLRRTVAETLATSYESPSGKQMPAELLDEALPETMGDLAGPDMVGGIQELL